MDHARSRPTFHAPPHNHFPAHGSRRTKICVGGIPPPQTATSHPQPFPTTVTAFADFRSISRRPLYTSVSSHPADPFSHRTETFDSLGPPPGLKNRKYRMLSSSMYSGKPGPKGSNQELIEAVVQMKQLNPAWGCPRIARQIALAFDHEGLRMARSERNKWAIRQ